MLRTSCLLLFASLSMAGCTGSAAKPPASTATEKPKVESDLAFTTISKKAKVSLNIQTEPARLTEVNEQLTLTGWIMAKPGHEVTLTAPAAGFVHFPDEDKVPVAGEAVDQKQELLRIVPEFSPVEKIQVDALKRGIESDLAKAEKTHKLAEIDHKRMQDLVDKNIRTKQDLQQAAQAIDLADIEVKAARDKLTYFERRTISLHAPISGTILQLHANRGQYVPLSAPLLTVINLQPTWVRVPIPENDWLLVDPTQKVKIALQYSLHDNTDKRAALAKISDKDNTQSPFLEASPAGRVAQVDPIKHTAELWYQLEPTRETAGIVNRFAKDQMVTVRVPMTVGGNKEKASLVPYSALIFDANGKAWIYLDRTEDKAPKHKYERRKVELVTAIDNRLVIRPSLANGELVVTHGAAALFSREFHKPPVSIAGEDE